MIKIYNLDKLCFMGYKLDRHATFHHIEKKEHGGLEIIENGAVLNPNIIEYKDIEIYIAVNKILKLINEQRDKPTVEQYQIISKLLSMFEAEHSKEKTSKGKKLIREKYLDRFYY